MCMEFQDTLQHSFFLLETIFAAPGTTIIIIIIIIKQGVG